MAQIMNIHNTVHYIPNLSIIFNNTSYMPYIKHNATNQKNILLNTKNINKEQQLE